MTRWWRSRALAPMRRTPRPFGCRMRPQRGPPACRCLPPARRPRCSSGRPRAMAATRRGGDGRRDKPEDEQADDGAVTPVDFRRAARAAALAELEMDQAAAPPTVDGGDAAGRSAGDDAAAPPRGPTELSREEIN